MTAGTARASGAAAAMFGELAGQESVVEQLRLAAAAAASSASPAATMLAMTHAWLFTGPPGSGRSVAARAFAAALLCADQGCGECTPATAAVAEVLARDGIGAEPALAAARAAQGHIGRARRLATDPEAARRRAEVLQVPLQIGVPRPGGGLGQAFAAAAALVRAAEAEAAAVTEELDLPEREALRKAFGEGSTGKGVAAAIRGAAGALKELEDRQKSRATRVKRDSLDRALLDLAGFYRDVLAVQLGADVELANEAQRYELEQLAAASPPEATVRRIEAIMKCRERLAASVAPLLAVEEMTLALAAR